MTDPCPPDYQKLIDAATWAFIRESEGWYPPETASAPIGRQRQIYDAMCRAFHKGYPPGVQVRDQPFGGVACRLYASARPGTGSVLYLHGGGFVVGGLESHDDVCAEICAATGLRVIAADYRLAPEHRHPAAFEDAFAAAQGVARQFPGPLVLAGDSAGGCLAAAVAHRARVQGPAIAGQVLIYPGLGGDRGRGSYIAHAEAPMLTRADVLFYDRIRFAEGARPVADPTARPLQDHDFTALPPTLILAAECDPLADDGPDYAALIRAAGGRAAARIEPGLVHGYLRARKSVPRARDSFIRITEAIAALAAGGWAGDVTRDGANDGPRA
ncbi:MAG: alpha/beta hydrolase [Rhodobacteraceae bacterium]|nr:alpha/beta hydrolase [Paracoccaceae bacterium]